MHPSKKEDNPLSLIPVTSNIDLLKCKRISQQIKTHSRRQVIDEVCKYLDKCLMGLNIVMTKENQVLLCQDIIQKYSGDSIEDIRECFMHGRQGTYSFEHESRHALTMQVFTLWMNQHLNKKIDARERQIELVRSKNEKAGREPIDRNKFYGAYKARRAKEREEETKEGRAQKALMKSEAEYLKYRAKFYDNKKKD